MKWSGLQHSLGEGVGGSDVDEVLVVELVVLAETVHVGGDLGGAGAFDGEREVGGQNGLIAGIVQLRAGLHLRVQTDVGHAVLPELDGHLGRSRKKIRNWRDQKPRKRRLL